MRGKIHAKNLGLQHAADKEKESGQRKVRKWITTEQRKERRRKSLFGSLVLGAKKTGRDRGDWQKVAAERL